jgi:hypothetical protein
VRSRFRVLINNRETGVSRRLLQSFQATSYDAWPIRRATAFLRSASGHQSGLVFDGSTYSQIATLRTGNTPTQMAITFDRSALLVANDNSQIANRYDLNSLQPMSPIVFPLGALRQVHCGFLQSDPAASRVAGPIHTIDSIDLAASGRRLLRVSDPSRTMFT